MTDLNVKDIIRKIILKTGLSRRSDSATEKDLRFILMVLIKHSHSPSSVETWFCSPLLVTSGETVTCLQVVSERAGVCWFCWKPSKSELGSSQGSQ